MILKVFQADTGRWFYYDNICLFTVKYETSDPNVPGTIDQVILLSSKRDPEETTAKCGVNFKNGKYLEIIFSADGYLLNDVGKTIEKIR